MRNLNKFLVIVSILFSLVSVSFKTYALDNSAREISNLSNDETSRIEKFVKDNMDKGSIPGLSVTIVKGDKTVYQKGFGYSDIASQKDVDSKTLFEIGSNSKAFTGLGILTLEKRWIN
ncbi:CubicO group peptidase (beta-lactamase class C family) [Clostridium beijerinckii]|uniref:serine hydrolase domain-containing protein n=1 Tax=Clostridium beijerinckii TaxID=1520 RepID=UPI00237A183B|nr:serine hydrolase domain-containing protein [Clostridium beijerinckii]NRZ58018.1 CubicO group peptidase (beta-lactamase class C family) [Clostridium beijerinckii]